MATREQLHKMIDDLPEAQVDPVADILASRGENGDDPSATRGDIIDDWDKQWGEPETVGLPESWKTFDDGTPQPDWVATLDAVRREHHDQAAR